MTTFVEARDVVVTLIHTALQTDRPTLPVFWANTKVVDLDTVGSLFLRVEVEFTDARQLTINNDPEHRTYGMVYFSVFSKEGTGDRATLDLFEYLTNVVKFQRSANYTFLTPRPGRREARSGWVSAELHAPFQFESLVG